MKKPAFFFSYLIFSLCLFSSVRGLGQNSYLDSLKSQYATISDIKEKMTILRVIARDEQETSKKIAYANELLELAEEHDSIFYQHAAELQLGIGYRFMGDLSQSLEHLLRSLKIAKEENDEELIGSSYGEIAATYASQGDVATSVQFMNKAIGIFKQRKDTIHLSIALLNTAYDYYTINKLDSSMLYGKQADQLVSNFSELSDLRRESLLAYIRGNMGITQAALGQEVVGIAALQNSISRLRSIDDYYAVADFMKFLGQIEFKIGKVNEAKNHAKEALELTEKYGLLELERDLNLLLFKISQAEKNFDQALDYHLAYTTLKDSIENKNVIRQMAQQRSAFELSQKETEVQLLKAQRKNQQAVIVIATLVIFAFAILIIVIFVYYRSKIRINRVLQHQKSSLERLNETKDKFFSIISHDLRGPISSLMGVSHLIRHFVEDEDKEQLLKMADHMEMTVEQLTVLLDNLLNWAMQQQGHFPNVPERVELASMVREVVEMFSNMAAGKKIEITVETPEDSYVWVDRNSVHTVLRNLINNAIKFTEEKGDIQVSIDTERDFAKLVVKDSGIGISESNLRKIFRLTGERSTYGTAGEKGLGLGLQLVNEFVKMNSGTIDVESKEGEGTTFIVKLPLFDKAQIAQEKVNA